jgi:N-acyl-D-amino-acid deacylase
VTQQNRDLAGLSVRAAAARRGKEDLEFLLDLLLQESGNVGRQSIQCSEEDVMTVLAHERAMIGSDGIDVENPHPRQYGCFPKVLGDYVREKHTLSLEAAIHKMTGLPAATFGFREIGLLRAGMRADVVVFDPATIRERGTFTDPARHPEGIEWVFVGGAAAVARTAPTGAKNGIVLKNAGA